MNQPLVSLNNLKLISFKRMFGCALRGVRIDFQRPKSILTIFIVIWFLIIKINYCLKIDSR